MRKMNFIILFLFLTINLVASPSQEMMMERLHVQVESFKDSGGIFFLERIETHSLDSEVFYQANYIFDQKNYGIKKFSNFKHEWYNINQIWFPEYISSTIAFKIDDRNWLYTYLSGARGSRKADGDYKTVSLILTSNFSELDRNRYYIGHPSSIDISNVETGNFINDTVTPSSYSFRVSSASAIATYRQYIEVKDGVYMLSENWEMIWSRQGENLNLIYFKVFKFNDFNYFQAIDRYLPLQFEEIHLDPEKIKNSLSLNISIENWKENFIEILSPLSDQEVFYGYVQKSEIIEVYPKKIKRSDLLFDITDDVDVLNPEDIDHSVLPGRYRILVYEEQ